MAPIPLIIDRNELREVHRKQRNSPRSTGQTARANEWDKERKGKEESGTPHKTLTKKSGNYIGKLRAKNVQRTDYLLLNHAAERQEVAGFMFDRADSLAETREGIRPRKLSVILPRLNNLGRSVPNRVGDDQDSSIIEILRATSSSDRHGMHMFETKEPAFINGNFRLNFNGRVSIPSVKNFQLIAEDDAENVLCQFGKVDDDKFHLDFKTPFNAFQAFALALSQFNL